MPEQQNIEYKEDWDDRYLAWISGFANARGGKLYIGCDDNGNPIGLPNCKELLEKIPPTIKSVLGIIVAVNRRVKQGKEYIEIDVSPYSIGISCKGIYYYRSGSANQILTGPALEEFLLQKRGVTWDNAPLPAFRVEDVDNRVVDMFKELAYKKGRIDPNLLEEPKEILMEKLHLTNSGYLTNAAMLLFSEDPEKYQTGAYIKIGYFESDADLIYQDEIHGSILEQVDKAVKLIYLKYMKAKISYEGLQRIERYFVPEEALREVLFNAVCHKHYQYGIPVQISVYEDKLYVANQGSLPENWTLDKLFQKHASIPYNPNIAYVFYLAGFIESWGRGIEKICRACLEDGVNKPQYVVFPRDITVKFTAPEYRIVRVNDRVNDKVNDSIGVYLTEREMVVLDYLECNPSYTVTEISFLMNVSRKTVAGYLKSLKQKNLIERIGSSKKGHWKVKGWR